MTRTPFILCACLAACLAAFAPAARAGSLGADVNADVDAFGHDQMGMAGLQEFAQKNTVYALPLFNAPTGDHARYWDSMAEQYGAAQVDFAAVWLKGNNQPQAFGNLVTALQKRGLQRRVKVMAFDDNPASWTALWNFEHGDGYGYKVPFDMSDPAHWAFVWDKNLKAFFQAVPDSSRYKIKGRPVYAIWSAAPAFVSNLNGNGSKMIAYLRRQCQATFGFNPYILVPGDWLKNDPSSAAPGVVDGVYPWFTPVPGPNYSTWNVTQNAGLALGTCIPQFHISNPADPNAPVWIVDPKHGETLTTGLKATIGAGAASTFIEGFDDYWENTTLWRARNLDENGAALGYDKTYYDYPNQRINLVRRQSNSPFPLVLTMEAEACDTFSGAAADPKRPNFYRNGPIAIEDTTDTGGGYDVCSGRAGETLRWQDVPIQGTGTLTVRAASVSGGKLHCVIDGKTWPAVRVPQTGGGQKWETVTLGAYTFPRGSTHTVSLVWDTPGISVNYWQARTTALPDGLYRIVTAQGGDTLTAKPGDTQTAPDTGADSQRWRLRTLGKGRVSLTALSGEKLGTQWTVVPQPDGFCLLRPAGGQKVLDAGRADGTDPGVSVQPRNGTPETRRQEWSFIPVN